MNLDQLPQPDERNIAIHLEAAAERAVKAGHPWLFENGIREQSKTGKAGDLAVLYDRKKRFLALGLYDPQSPIRVKILQHGTGAKIGQDFFYQRLEAAKALRQALDTPDTTGYRLVYGESDYLPSLIIDRYADTLVLKLYTAAWLPHLRDFLPALEAVFPAERWVLRLSRAVQAQDTFGLSDGQVLKGQPLNGAILFSENGLRFAADVVHGHKTGFFFDQRENRAKVGELAEGRRVLDVFAYNGGFSLYAAAGGAKSVLSVDISAPALESAKANFLLNRHLPNVVACQHEVLAVDAFSGLWDLAQAGRRFGLIIVDPPSFAKSQAEVAGALQAYRRLTELAVRLLEPAGLLVMASCSSRVSPEDFFKTVQQAARSAYPLQVIAETGHALDHPVLESFPEGRYLKCWYAQV